MDARDKLEIRREVRRELRALDRLIRGSKAATSNVSSQDPTRIMRGHSNPVFDTTYSAASAPTINEKGKVGWTQLSDFQVK